MGEFRLAGAYVEARLDRKKLDADIARLEKKELKVRARVDLDTTAANARIAALVKARRTKVTLDLDSKATTAALAKIVKAREVQLTASLSTRVAAEELGLITRARTVRILADADTRVAAEELRNLTRDRTIRFNVDVDSTALGTLLSDSHTVDISPEVNQPSYDRAEKKLDKLTADRTVRILASADTRVAADEIRNLTRRQRVRIGVDVDTRVAANDIANLTRRRMLRVTADADTTAAAQRIAFLTRDRRINIRTNLIGFGSLAGLGGSLGSAGAGAGMLGSRFAMLASAALLALPTVASLGSAIAQMGPAAAIAVPALGSLITLGAALGVGLKGVGTAFKSAFEQGASSATSAASAARALESAQIGVARAARALREAQVDAARQIEDAQRRVKEAAEDVRDAEVRAAADRRAALQRVADAERDLADAQKDAARAQEDLNEARKTAQDQLEDLGNRLASAELDQRDAVIDLADAEKDLAAVKAKGSKATADELAKAQLAYDRAVQRLKEQQLETERLTEEQAEAAQKGVEGSDTVKAAQEQLADAQRNVGDKARDVGEAQANAAQVAKDGIEAVRDAQQALREAQQGVADAQVAAARQVRNAQEALADANRAVAAAMAQGSTEAIKFNDAMAKLSPNARSFVNAVRAIAPAWSAVRVDVQDALFRGLGATLTRMSQAVLPSVRDGLVGMAGVLNNMGRGLMDTFTRLANEGLLKRMFDSFTNGMKPLERIPGQLAQAFVQLSIAAGPAFQRMTEGMGKAADSWTQKLTQAFESGRLTEVINQAVEVARQFGELLGNIFGTIGNIMKAASAGGGSALASLNAVFAELRRITAMPEVQRMLTSVFTALNAIAKLIATVLGAVIQAVLPLLAALAPTVTALANALGPVLAELAIALGKALMPIIIALLPVVKIVGDALIALVSAVSPLLEPIGKLIAAVVVALAPVLDLILDQAVALAASLASALVPVIIQLIPIVQMFGSFIGALVPIFPQLITAFLPLLGPLSQLTVSLLKLAMEVIQPLMPLIVLLAGLLAGVLTEALGILVPVLQTVIGWITTFVDKISEGVQWVVDKFQWMYDILVGNSIIPDLVQAIIKWFSDLWTGTKRIFTQLKDGVVAIWNQLWAGVRSKWDSFYNGLRNGMSTAWSWVRNSFSTLRTWVTNLWSTFWTGLQTKFTSIINTIRDRFNSFRTGLQNLFGLLRDGIGKIWSGVQSKIAAPIRYVVNFVYNDGIRRMWNTIAGKISSKITLPAIKLGFNTGGVVPGGRGTRDTVPAMLTPGERVLSNTEVDRLGGYRAIDAMVGKDRITGTGGNPNKRQAAKMQVQPAAQFFDEGGIVGSISSAAGAVGGMISSGVSWAKDLVIGGLKAAAQKAISSLVRPLINRIPDGGTQLGKLVKGIPNSALNQILEWFGKEDKKAVGGPAIQRGLAWARTQHGLPYQWAGNGNPSWDCSGFTSAIESVLRGQRPHRRWATGAFHGATAPSGWVRNLVSPYMIGITNAGVGHVAGTIAGVNVESRGGDGVVVGPRARSYKDGMFTDRYGYAPATKYDSGGLLGRGRTLVDNQTGRPERVLGPEHTAKLDAILASAAGTGGGVTIENIHIAGTFDFASPAARRAAAQALVAEMKEALRVYDRERN
ncbi:hypothetical protein [Streptomyces sp. NPDC096153]|uniref:hypothetical protein n=1 Tax=Streptomyces sp. NPDC096153 TaxID=3155548 RepID=UPI003324B281